MPFHRRCPDVAAKETRSISVFQRGDLPIGQYGFVELYCDDPQCDCRRVIISVISPPMGPAPLATINYGWERAEFYAAWLGSWHNVGACKGTSLDPLNPQTAYADALLALFETALVDEHYRRRFARHYALFKSTLPRKPRLGTRPRRRGRRARRPRK